MADELVLHSFDPEATSALGVTLGENLVGGALLVVDGDLGAGKTLLVKGLARGLGIEDRVDSPTFTLMKEYEGRLPLYHYDAWMQGRERAFLEGGGEESLQGDGVAVIEWGSRVGDLLPEPRLELRIDHRSPTERRLAFRVQGPRGPHVDPLADALRRTLDALAELARRRPDLEEQPPGPGEPV